MSDMRPWEADLIDADHYDRIVLLRRWFRDELADAENDVTLKPLE